METLYIVMPAYNEEANIRSVVEDWYPLLEGKSADSRLVIADTGSTDATHDILTDLIATHPQLITLPTTLKQHGPKLIALYRYALDSGADYIFQTDSDGQTSPSEFSAFWDLREDASAILGCRPVRGDGPARALVEKIVCILLRFIFGVRVPDANAPFRLMRADLVGSYLPRFAEDYNLPNIMFTTFFAYYKDPVIFRDISFKPRQGGHNSINIPKIIKIGFHALRDFYSFRNHMRKGD